MNEKEYIDDLFNRLAKKKINLIIEYITQILNDKDIVNGSITFDTLANYLRVDIRVLEKGFQKCFNLISLDYINLFYTYFFDTIFNTFKDSETIAISPILNKIRISNFRGMRLTNLNGSSLTLNFKNLNKGNEIFNQKADEYNHKIELAIGRELTIEDFLKSCLDITIVPKDVFYERKK